MSKLFGVLIILVVSGILLALAVGYASDRAAEQDRAEAVVIRAQAESRLTSATATAITTTALLPWFSLTILGVLGLAVMALAGAIITRHPGPRTIEVRTIVYLPAPGQTRREIWRGISQVKAIEPPQVMVIEQPNYKRLEGASEVEFVSPCLKISH